MSEVRLHSTGMVAVDYGKLETPPIGGVSRSLSALYNSMVEKVFCLRKGYKLKLPFALISDRGGVGELADLVEMER